MHPEKSTCLRVPPTEYEVGASRVPGHLPDTKEGIVVRDKCCKMLTDQIHDDYFELMAVRNSKVW